MAEILKRKFKGIWIPRAIWLDESLPAMDKIILVEIDSLDNDLGCTAGNEYFARFFQISGRQVKRYITRLESSGWIKVTVRDRRYRTIRVTEKFESMRDENVPHMRDINAADEGQKRPANEGQKRPSSNTEENNISSNRILSPEEFFHSKELQEKVITWLVGQKIPHEVAVAELKKFIAYWMETNASGKKQRWQGEKYFDLRRRLATWFSNVRKFAGKSTGGTQNRVAIIP